MPSTSTIHRLKPRGGSGSKISASLPTPKALTPLSDKPTTKPNPRSASGPAHKPTTRPIPRSDGLDSRPKSRPRGRTPSPSDFSRLLSDVRKVRVSDKKPGNGKENGSCFTDKIQSNGQPSRKESELCSTDRNFSDKNQSNGHRSRNDSELCDKYRNFSDKSRINGRCYRKEGELRGKDGNFSDQTRINGRCSTKESELCGKDRSGSGGGGNGRGENGTQFSDKIQTDGQRLRKESDLSDKDRNVRGCDENVASESRVLESSKGKGVNGEGVNDRVGSNKNASKLHEKLAYLEGKVKRIASDIKKTKELLDLNNTDASKLILSDIQEKISGIEKAMGNVIIDSNLRVSSGRGSCSGDNVKVSVKGLSDEELEARVLPHQKLLRDRTLLEVETSVHNVEEDPIEMEFLASLSKVGAEISVTTKNGTSQSGGEVKETEETDTSNVRQGSGNLGGNESVEVELEAVERLDEFDDQENKAAMIVGEETEDVSIPQLIEIGCKTCTGGWFVSEGESVLLAHDDASCSFYDIANQEEKAEYRPPSGMSQNIWRDCWIIRAPGADGCSGKYVVAASAGNTMDSGFCSWDFYTKEVEAFHTEDYKTAPRVALGPLPDNLMYRRNALGGIMSSENLQWWYRPCGPLIVSTASYQRGVKVFDIRDGEEILKWNVEKAVLAMDYSSPLQWRNRGKVVVAETEAISVWDVSSLNPQPLSSVSTSGHRILALHVNNTDAELGGGVRQRVSSSEAEGNDGVFCTSDSINIIDFRNPSGIGLKIPKMGVNFESVSCRGDSVFVGCTTITSTTKKQVCSQVLQLCVRNQKIVKTYGLPESNAHSHHRALTQVWGNSNLVMAVSGLGLFVYDTDISASFGQQKVRDVIGPDDLYSPSFDYTSSQLLLISRDRPAMWRHVS